MPPDRVEALAALETIFEDVDRIALLSADTKAVHAGVPNDVALSEVLDELDRQTSNRHRLTPVMKITNQDATWLLRDHGGVRVGLQLRIWDSCAIGDVWRGVASHRATLGCLSWPL